MIEFKKLLSEEKERLDKILEDDVVITKKYRGSKIFFIKNGDKISFKKKGNRNISRTDLLISDNYFLPINKIKESSDNFEDGKHILTYCADTNKIHLDVSSGASVEGTDISSNFACHHGELSHELKNKFKRGWNKKILEHFGVDDSVDSLIVRGLNVSDSFKIKNVSQYKSTKPNKAYCEVINDVISKISPDELKKIMTSQTDKESVYIAIIDRMFLCYMNKSEIDFEAMDFGYPKGMKSELYVEKAELMNPNVFTSVIEHQSIFDLYVALIASFRNDHMKWNELASKDDLEGFSNLRETIKMVMSNPILYSETPSYLEYIGDK